MTSRGLLIALAAVPLAVGPVPAGHAEVLPTGCTVALALADPGETRSCRYAAVGTSGTHRIRVYGGFAQTEVTCTTGGNYMAQPAGHAVDMPFDRTGTCQLTLTAVDLGTTINDTTATASAD